MPDLATTAEQLRQVRQATREFLVLHALESLRSRVRSQGQAAGGADERDLADFTSHDWSLLYRGSVLDD
jgi:hypothetical protein